MTVRKVILSAVLVTGLCLSCSGDGPTKPLPDKTPVAKPVPAGVGQLEKVEGAVTLTRDAKPGKAVVGPLQAGDVIETGDDGEAVLLFPGGRRVELGPNGRFEVQSKEGGLTLRVESGLVLTRVPPGGGVDTAAQMGLTIDTPFGITRIGASDIELKVGDGDTQVKVNVGEVEMLSRDGSVVKLTEGKSGGFKTTGQVRELPPVEINIVLGNSRVEYKGKGAKAFAAVKPKALPKLAEGDTLRVKDGRMTLQADGSGNRYSLARGGEVVIGVMKRGNGVEQTDLALSTGELQVVAQKGQATRVGIGNGVTLVSDLGGQFSVLKTKNGFEVTSTAGAVRVEREGEKESLIPGGRAGRIEGKEFTLREMPKDAVTLPSRTGMKLFHTNLPRVTLTWEGPDDVDYGIEVANEPTFANPSVQGLIHQRYISVPVPARGPIFWRVSQADKELTRGNVACAPESSAGDLGRLKNEVVDGPDKTTIYFQDKPPVVNFLWVREPEAVKYRVRVYREGELSKAVAERTVNESSLALPEGTLAEGQYLWSVAPLGPKGDELRGSRMNKLAIVYDNAVPSLVIKTPRNGDAGGARVHITGIAPVGSRLLVNGRSVELDKASRFDSEVAPLPGGRVVFRLLQGASELYTVRTVRGGG